MELVGAYTIKCAPNSTQHLYQFTDWHILSALCAQKQIDQLITRIKNDPLARVVGTGDLIEGINYNDIRFSPAEFPKKILARDLADFGQYSFDALYEMVKPIQSKILALGYGNHEKVLLTRTNSFHLWRQFIEKVGCADLKYAGMLDLIYRVNNHSHKFRVATHHGAGYAQKAGGVTNRLEQFLETFDCDIFLMGHLHKRQVHNIVVLGADECLKKVTQTERMGVVGASYLRTYTKGISGYGEERGYRGAPLGNPCITIQPESRHLGVVW